MKYKTIVLLFALAALLAVAGSACRETSKEPKAGSGQTAAYYTCPMHPSVRADKPGACPVCGMGLVAVYTNAPMSKP